MHSDTIDCPFCRLPHDRILIESKHALAFYDGFPVTQYHSLVIPKRHVATYFDLTSDERTDIHQLLVEMKGKVSALDPEIGGFNIGWNCGECSGQTVFHAHVHLIPRRSGDVESPRGGVRHLIPGKGSY